LRRQHNAELHNVFHQLSFGWLNNKNEIEGACGTYGIRRGTYRVWMGEVSKIDHWKELVYFQYLDNK
jgi:hypothetical protein